MDKSPGRFDDVAVVKGIGEKKRLRLQSIGINTVGQLLDHFPYRYKDMRTVKRSRDTGGQIDELVCGRLIRVYSRSLYGKKSVTECVLEDESGRFNAVFFNMPYLKQNLKTGTEYCVFGRMKLRNKVPTWTNPEIFECGGDKDARGLIPVYHCTSGLTNNDFNKWIKAVLDKGAAEYDWIDKSILDEAKICSSEYAYRNIHFPESSIHYKYAKYRLIFDRLLIYQLALRMNRQRINEAIEDASIEDVDVGPFLQGLPFELTACQKDCLADIENDLVSKRMMNRLVQGDVGCGKTVMAEAAIYKCVKAGHQAAMMAPTEILARQHYAHACEDLGKHGIRCRLLISGMKASERKKLLKDIIEGNVDVVIGTHAIIQDDVEFRDIALVITDEQHRFGVNQRKSLVGKGRGVNVCVMSATPIPRTLAATVFGDMDFSIIKSKPANRLEIITRAVHQNGRKRAYASAADELAKGHQVYVVAPSIANEDEDMASAETLYEEIRGMFPDYKVALLHGRLDKNVKENIMQDFAAGKIDVLVATVVIEVGIDVPNATIMIIENADRFGLAQMHQLRGRVGRSELQSYCYIVTYGDTGKSEARAKALVNISDGFEISEEDYRLRGPGDIMGTMQSGNYTSSIISLCSYTEILERAIKYADRIMQDPLNTDLDYVRSYYATEVEDNSTII
ncbi:MAG: ATP-dependent DNA helicase RecG [Clostridiales bacterium]|nr:ATP-dependent DNA helicase RecG [Candidatus Crickella caballi]